MSTLVSMLQVQLFNLFLFIVSYHLNETKHSYYNNNQYTYGPIIATTYVICAVRQILTKQKMTKINLLSARLRTNYQPQSSLLVVILLELAN